MPELPEVETIRRALALELPGLRVEAGRRFLSPRRRGKYLLLDLDPPGSLLAHLGMSGTIQLVDASSPLRNHTHLRLEPRRFGFVDWLEPGAEISDPSLAALGVEPLSPGLDEALPPMLHTRRAPLKSLLLDQRLVAGVGNIYAVEALWRAGIHPRRAGNRTSLIRLNSLARAVQEVLAEAVTQGGTTLRDFSDPSGEMGYFAIQLAVYGRQGKKCGNCGATIRAEVIGGRTTAWCPQCQR
jgi:formamidopyrimidine-DNA glycosylase